MIDKMIRCKDLTVSNEIESLHEWFYKCPPKAKLKHWKDGRSAKETAKYWLYTIPKPFLQLLNEQNMVYQLCSPEYVTKFDDYKGEGRNHDLLILAKDNNTNPIVISIESKADEPFGDNVKKRIESAINAKRKNINSRAKERINELWLSLFGEAIDENSNLKYQLMTAVAGTIAEAKKQNAKTAYFLVQTFVEQENQKHQHNKMDLDYFINKLSKGIYSNLDNNQMVGPFTVAKATEKLPNDIELFIGKFEIQI